MKKLLTLFFLVASLGSLAQSTDAQLTTQANVIQNETSPGGNTKERIASMFKAIINSKQSTIAVAATTGTNTYALTANSAITSYITGDVFWFRITEASSGASTLNVNSIGARKIYIDPSTQADSGDLVDETAYVAYYNAALDGGAGGFLLISSGGGGGGGGGAWGSITGTLSDQTDLQSALNLKAPLASPTFTGTVTMPTPFTLGATSVTSTGTQLNYLNAATGTTGTASTNLVYSTSPTLVTPALGTPSALVLTNATGLPGTAVINTPAGNIAATDVQAAIDELDGEKIESVTGDGVDNTDPLNPVMDLSGYTPNITTFNSQSTDYTFELTDGNGNTEVQLTGSTGRSFTIPPNASVAFPIGTIIYASRQGSGVFTWVAGAGVTLQSTKGDLIDPGQYVLMAAKKEATNTWKIYNGLSFALSSGDVTSALGYTPVPPTRTIAGVDLADNITQAEAITALDSWHRVTISSDVVVASTGYVDITGLLFPISANERVEFKAELYVNAANSSEGWTSSFTGPTLTNTRYAHNGFGATNTITTHLCDEYDEGDALIAASSLVSMGQLYGRVLTSASGNIQFRFRTETGGINITVKSGSYVEYRVVGVNN